MNPEQFSEWLASLSASQREETLVRMYSILTVYTRELFLPDIPKEKHPIVLDRLHGINELHHTISNQMSRDDNEWLYFAKQLKAISDQYQLAHWLDNAAQWVQTREL